MNIEYVQPLTIAWNRMVLDLFKPFRAGRWFAVGFAAFLVRLGGGGGGGGVNVPTGSGGRGPLSGEEEKIFQAVKDFFLRPAGISLLVGLVLGAILLALVLVWLSSRAQFVFLDQVTGRHWRIADPWTRYGTQGNSLFLWKLGFTFALIAVAVVLIGPVIVFMLLKHSDQLTGPTILAAIWAVLVCLAMIVPAAYVQCFLHSFIVPLMYRENLKTNDAWRRFLPLLRAHTGAFILYGLFLFALAVGLFVAVMTFSCVTCCIGACLLAIPYLGTVFSLPIPYTLRAIGPSFLAQFGSEYWSWPPDTPVAPIEPLPPVAPAAT